MASRKRETYQNGAKIMYFVRELDGKIKKIIKNKASAITEICY